MTVSPAQSCVRHSVESTEHRGGPCLLTDPALPAARQPRLSGSQQRTEGEEVPRGFMGTA